MAAGWGVFKDMAIREPPKHVLETQSMNGPIHRDFQLRWIQGKREGVKEKKLLDWITRLTGERTTPNAEFGDALKDGVLLCKLINKIQPGSVKRIHVKGEYALRENVGNFVLACRRFGLREEDCFTTWDLCDRSDLSQVASTLLSLADLVRLKHIIVGGYHRGSSADKRLQEPSPQPGTTVVTVTQIHSMDPRWILRRIPTETAPSAISGSQPRQGLPTAITGYPKCLTRTHPTSLIMYLD